MREGPLNDGRVDVSNLAAGQYLLRVSDVDALYGAEFVVRK